MSVPLPDLITLGAEVRDALAAGVPIVALESAVISHGLPRPTGIETAIALEEEVRRGGAVPATVVLLDGRIKVGAAADDLARLTDPGAKKVAERDLGVAVAARADGGTTVSATLAVAALCGIEVMSTGGIGGVHLGAADTWDVSADLSALARHSVLVVCAGAKAICDVPKTLEVLETLGVPVIGYATDRFPRFYARDSGSPAPHRIDDPGTAAEILTAHRALGRHSGVIVAQPVPAADALPASFVESAVAAAVTRTRGVRGAALTPALLAALAEITAGRTLRANIALLRSNAELASAISRALHRKGF